MHGDRKGEEGTEAEKKIKGEIKRRDTRTRRSNKEAKNAERMCTCNHVRCCSIECVCVYVCVCACWSMMCANVYVRCSIMCVNVRDI